MKKSVSIVIPTFNRANYLKQCIDSALAQTYPCEIIVCDHGSIDHTPELARAYGSEIIYVRREKDSGVHFCWLDGILHASSDFIHINYDDDWIDRQFIEQCMQLFNDKVGLVYSNAKVFFEKENQYTYPLFPSLGDTGIYPSSCMLKYEMRGLISPGAMILRKKIILDNLFCCKVPFARTEYKGVGPDLLFSLMTTVDYNKIGYVDKCLAFFRAHDKSITIDASFDKEKAAKIHSAYEEGRKYYFIAKLFRKTKFDLLLLLLFRVLRRLRMIV